MNKENTDKLRELFPGLLRQMDLPMSQTCMCWGFECGDGWYELVHDMLAEIEDVDPDCELCQVKEKWGTLRIYVDKVSNAAVHDITSNYEELSTTVCEECGSKDDVKPSNGWIRYLCGGCRN